MIPAPLSPGFSHPVFDAQITFRQLLNALAHPGRIYPLDLSLNAPLGLDRATAAACLCLLDLETSLWMDPNFSPEVLRWLVFHTGCHISPDREPFRSEEGVLPATFALLTAPPPLLADFNMGTPEYPESSTLLLIQVPDLEQGLPVQLQGCGILSQETIAPQVPVHFWEDWQAKPAFPLGVDVFFFAKNRLMGLPRTIVGKVL